MFLKQNDGENDWNYNQPENRRRWNIILSPATQFSIGGVDGLETNTVPSPNNFQVTASCDA
jgi:hypothetical protein